MAKVCIIGGGATGAALLWTLGTDPGVSADWRATLLHDGDTLGGHRTTVPVEHRGVTIPVDAGMPLIAPALSPNVLAMLGMPEFRDVGLTPVPELRLACAFPTQRCSGTPMNWGNFPEYQKGPEFALYDAEMAGNAERFQEFVETASPHGWARRSVADFFADPPIPLTEPTRFLDFFVAPYLSIMSGYRGVRLDQATFADLLPLFATGPGRPAVFTEPGAGWARFTRGGSAWVQRMCDLAGRALPTDLRLGARVGAVWTDRSAEGNPVHVVWTDATGEHRETFDKVVLTTDMWTCAEVLANPRNAELWHDVYATHLAREHWPLLSGACCVHTDETILSPDLTERLETLQYTAHYARTGLGGYDPARTFTTFILKNLLDDRNADGLYLSIYGDTTADTRMPEPATVLYSRTWTHGPWAASSPGVPEKGLHLAQGLGCFSCPGQADTNVYFAGDNSATDSAEGALISAMAIANYAFGVRYPLRGGRQPALSTFLARYFEVMFPDVPLSARLAAIRTLHPH